MLRAAARALDENFQSDCQGRLVSPAAAGWSARILQDRSGRVSFITHLCELRPMSGSLGVFCSTLLLCQGSVGAKGRLAWIQDKVLTAHCGCEKELRQRQVSNVSEITDY